MKEIKLEMENKNIALNTELSNLNNTNKFEDSIQKRFCEDCEIKVHNNRRYLRKRKKKEENKV